LYTEAFAKGYALENYKAVNPYTDFAERAIECALGINAGHDLCLDNIKFFKENVPRLLEVSIGHALISESLYFGVENVINMYKNRLQ
jgi:pyridoxine 5-phosphate synthase